jgi:hypothetical protein
MVSQEPSPRAAVKAREATAKRLGLDGERGDGIARRTCVGNSRNYLSGYRML